MIYLYSGSQKGHRREYVQIFEKLLTELGLQVTVSSDLDGAWRRNGTPFFLMIEEAPITFALTALFRALFFLKTAGLLLRPTECVRPVSLRTRLKRTTLSILTKFRSVKVLTILPLEIEPRFREIASGGFCDPQMWDLEELHRSRAEPTALTKGIVDIADGRKICIALGEQNYAKGFNFFLQLWISSERVRSEYLFVVAGIISQATDDLKKFTLLGGLVVDRFLSDQELRGLYEIATVVWACYSPQYDQASGIFGRAFQLGVPVIVRRGSYIEKLARAYEHPIITLEWNNMNFSPEMMAVPERRNISKVTAVLETMKREASSLLKLSLDSKSSRR